MKKLSAAIVSIAIILTLVPTYCFAISNEISEETPYDEQILVNYQYVENASALISISGGTATATVRVRDLNGDTTKLECKMYLQKYSNGSWSAEKSWSKRTNSNTLTMSGTKAVTRGKYRVKGVIKAYKGTKHETITVYSSATTY